jgi:hypothetical protein
MTHCNPIQHLKANSISEKFLTNSKELMRRAETWYPGQPFRVITDSGEVVILPPELGDEVRNEPKLSFSAAAAIVRY